MNGKLKNIEKGAILELKEQVSYQDGQIVSKTLVQNESVSLTLFAFEKGEEISTHAAGGDALVTVLEGTGKFTIIFFIIFIKQKMMIVYFCTML